MPRRVVSLRIQRCKHAISCIIYRHHTENTIASPPTKLVYLLVAPPRIGTIFRHKMCFIFVCVCACFIYLPLISHTPAHGIPIKLDLSINRYKLLGTHTHTLMLYSIYFYGLVLPGSDKSVRLPAARGVRWTAHYASPPCGYLLTAKLSHYAAAITSLYSSRRCSLCVCACAWSNSYAGRPPIFPTNILFGPSPEPGAAAINTYLRPSGHTHKIVERARSHADCPHKEKRSINAASIK